MNLVRILLIEDNDGDVLLVRKAFEQNNLINELLVAPTANEGLKLLREKRPEVVLLDLNLPGKSGLEVLEEIKQDEELKRTVVVILTSSPAEKDVLKSYDLHANLYIVKPLDFNKLIEVVKQIGNLFLGIATLPSQGT